MVAPKPVEEVIIARPEDIVPSSDDMQVIGCINPGGTLFREGDKEQTYLLVRVIEKTKTKFPGHIASPRAIQSETGDYEVRLDWERKGIDARVNGPCSFQTVGPEERVRLTTISHFRLMKSEDGINFNRICDKPTFFPLTKYEEFGVEDPRITRFDRGIDIDGETYGYLMSYVGCSEDYDICTAFAVTNDFKSFVRLPKDSPKIIFSSPSKDVVLFPKKILNPRTGEEEYLALTRPMGGGGYMIPSIFLSYSKDLIQWGDYTPLVKGDEKGHVGAGPPPIEVEEGWLIIYHQHRHLPKGAEQYVARALLVDKNDPSRILRNSGAFLEPHTNIQTEGSGKNVTFPSAAILHDDKILVYTGEEDAVTALHIHELTRLMVLLQPI